LIWVKAFEISKEKYRIAKFVSLFLLIYLNLPILIRAFYREGKTVIPEWIVFLFVLPGLLYLFVAIVHTLFAILYYFIKWSIKGIISLILFMNSFIKKKPKSKNLFKRSKYPARIKRFAFILPLIIFIYAIYGNIRSFNSLEITTTFYKSAALPHGLNGLKAVLISDIHAGLLVRQRQIEKLSEIVNGLKPEIIFLTGDFIDRSIAYLPELINGLQKIKHVKYGIYACLGNHDYY